MPFEGEFAHYRPLQRLSDSEQVQALLRRARIKPRQTDATPPVTVSLADLVPSRWAPHWVLAVDGSLLEHDINNGYPSASVGYVTVASVLLDIAKMVQLDAHRPIDPRSFRTLEQAESIDCALPGSNVVIDDELDANASFRRALFELFQSKRMAADGESLLDTYEALLAYKPIDSKAPQLCPFEKCLRPDGTYQLGHAEYRCTCLQGRSLFSTDALRIHEIHEARWLKCFHLYGDDVSCGAGLDYPCPSDA